MTIRAMAWAADVSSTDAIYFPLIMGCVILGWFVGSTLYLRWRFVRAERDETAFLRRQVFDLSTVETDLKVEILGLDEKLRDREAELSAACDRMNEALGETHRLRAERDEAIAERGRIEDSYRKALARHEQMEAALRAENMRAACR